MSTAPAKSIYNTRAWRRARLACLDRDEWRCRYCGRPARTAHHNPPLEILLAAGLDPYDLACIFSACRHCHGVEDGQRAHPPKPARQNRFAPWA